MATELPKRRVSKCPSGLSPQRRRAGRTFLPTSVHAHHIVFCLVICIGKVVTRRACGWRTRQFPHLQPPFPLQILPRKSIKSFFLAFVVLVDISRSHPVHTSFLFIRFSMSFGRFSERFLLCERGARSSYSNHSAAKPPAEQYGAAQRR